jgi:hypothetical protein
VLVDFIKDTSILFIVPASDIKSSSVSSGAEAKASCPDITVLSKESALTVPAAGLIVPTAFA